MQEVKEIDKVESSKGSKEGENWHNDRVKQETFKGMQMKEVDKEFLNKVIPELEFWNMGLMWAFWKSEG